MSAERIAVRPSVPGGPGSVQDARVFFCPALAGPRRARPDMGKHPGRAVARCANPACSRPRRGSIATERWTGPERGRGDEVAAARAQAWSAVS